MDVLLFLVGILIAGGIPVGLFLGFLAFLRVNRLTRQVDDLQREVRRLQVPLALPRDMAATPVAAPPAIPTAPAEDLAPTTPTIIEAASPTILASVPLDHASVPASTIVLSEDPPPSAFVDLTPSDPEPQASPSIPVPSAQDGPVTPPAGHYSAPAPSHASEVESAIGKRWLTWSGIALVFLSAVFLLKYAYDQDWLGRVITPPIRVAGLGLVALGMVAGGLRLVRRQMPALGHGLAGGGVAMAYLAVYGGFSPALRLAPEPLFSGTIAFGLMAMVTALGMTMAVRADAISLAIAAVVGGFATPVLIDTGGGSREALFTYLLLLDLGVLGAAWFRQWRALDAVAFAGTSLVVFGWYHGRESSGVAPWPMLVWLPVFHVVFLIIPFAWHWRQRTVVTVERFALAVGNLAFTLSFSAVLLREGYQLTLAAVCLALAGLYAGIGIMTRRRLPQDAKVGHGFLVLGIMLTTLGLLYLLPVEAVATAWIVEAATLLVLSYRYQHRSTRFIAYVVMVIGLARLTWKMLTVTDVGAPFWWNSWVLTGLAAPLGLVALGTIHRFWGRTATDYRQQLGSWWLAGLSALLLGCAEVARHAEGHPQDWQLLLVASAQAGWWTIGGIVALLFSWRRRCLATGEVALAPVLAGVLFALASYGLVWPGGIPVLNPRFLIFILTLGGLGWWIYRTGKDPLPDRPALRPKMIAGLHAASVLGVTLETCSWFDRPLQVEAAASSLDEQVTLTLVWAGCALVGLVTSYVGRHRPSAMIALIPLGMAVVSGFFSYFTGDAQVVLAANPRFLAVIFAIAVVAGQRLVFLETPSIGTGAHLLATLAGTCELVSWFDHEGMSSDTRAFELHWSLAMLWASSAGLAGLRRLRGAGSEAVTLALFLVFLAAIAALSLFTSTWHCALPFVNRRFLAAVAAVAVLVWLGRVAFRTGQASPSLAWWAVAIGFFAATCEAPVYFHDVIADPGLAHRLAIFSVTVVWVVLAAIALVLGFRWQRPVVRYLALGLLGLTAVKLLLVDMSGVQQLYCILSFLLVGVALIGASYAYHRLERRLTNPPPADRDNKPD